jgi:hypothetical protein
MKREVMRMVTILATTRRSIQISSKPLVVYLIIRFDWSSSFRNNSVTDRNVRHTSGTLNKWSTPWSAAAWRRFGQRRLVAASWNQLKQAWPRQVATGQSAARPAHSKEFPHPPDQTLSRLANLIEPNAANRIEIVPSSRIAPAIFAVAGSRFKLLSK